MKKILISVRPQWCEKIASGKKTIEVRKSAPEEVPFKCYIYETQGRTETPWVDEDGHFIYKGRGQVIGEFVCNEVKKYEPQVILCAYYEVNGAYVKENLRYNSGTCLSYEDMVNYSKDKPLYGWHISDLKIYDKPKELSEFKTGCKGCKERDTYHCYFYCYGERPLTRAPQSWQYVEEVKE